MERDGVSLARRISGGGAVYHDAGNLNVGVIVPRTEYREEKQYELILRTLEKFGITASKLRKNSLAVDGKKFSGQAFCFRGQHVLHHGTLLVNSDLKRLGRYLGSEIEGIETKAVASVPAEVANLVSFAPELTVEKLSAALIEMFRKMYGLRPVGAYAPEGSGGSSFAKASADRVVEYGSDADILEKTGAATQLLSSNDWKLCHTPRFQVTISGQTLDVEKGRVANLDDNPLFEEWVKK